MYIITQRLEQDLGEFAKGLIDFGHDPLSTRYYVGPLEGLDTKMTSEEHRATSFATDAEAKDVVDQLIAIQYGEEKVLSDFNIVKVG